MGHISNDDFYTFLQELVDGNDLEDHVEKVVQNFISKGYNALSEKEKLIFKKEIKDVYKNIKCNNCGREISFSELYWALDTHLCNQCTHILQSDR